MKCKYSPSMACAGMWQKGDFAFKSKNNQGQDIDIYKYAGRESIIKECEDSLRRLGTDYIDLYQIHWPDKPPLYRKPWKLLPN